MKYFAGEYDVAVIGAGHAGIEAALAAARLGCKTAVLLLIWMPSATVLAIRQSAERQKVILFVKLTHSAAKWARLPTNVFAVPYAQPW